MLPRMFPEHTLTAPKKSIANDPLEMWEKIKHPHEKFAAAQRHSYCVQSFAINNENSDGGDDDGFEEADDDGSAVNL